jgi:hypothetical protein
MESVFHLPVVSRCVLTNDDIASLWKIKRECNMNSIPYHSNNSVKPAWVTLDGTVNIIKKQAGVRITANERFVE